MKLFTDILSKSKSTDVDSAALIQNLNETPLTVVNTPRLVGLGAWVEREGFLFFDTLKLPHPAGFNTKEYKISEYIQKLNQDATVLLHLPNLMETGIKEIASMLNDSNAAMARSFRVKNDYTKLEGKTLEQLAKPYASFFKGPKSSDKANFVDLYQNAGDFISSTNELKFLNDRSGELLPKLAKLTERLNELGLELYEEYGDTRQVQIVAEDLIKPIAYWVEYAAIFLYRLNVVNVCYAEIEEKLSKISKIK